LWHHLIHCRFRQHSRARPRSNNHRSYLYRQRIVPKILRNVFSQLRQIARDGPPIYLLIFAGNRRYQFRGSGIIIERIGEVVADPT
jgi:hypothetical protein